MTSLTPPPPEHRPDAAPYLDPAPPVDPAPPAVVETPILGETTSEVPFGPVESVVLREPPPALARALERCADLFDRSRPVVAGVFASGILIAVAFAFATRSGDDESSAAGVELPAMTATTVDDLGATASEALTVTGGSSAQVGSENRSSGRLTDRSGADGPAGPSTSSLAPTPTSPTTEATSSSTTVPTTEAEPSTTSTMLESTTSTAVEPPGACILTVRKKVDLLAEPSRESERLDRLDKGEYDVLATVDAEQRWFLVNAEAGQGWVRDAGPGRTRPTCND